MIYSYLLTPHEIFNISQCSKLRMDRYPYAHGSEPEDFKIRGVAQAQRPHFIDPDMVHAGFASEVVQLHYELFRHFWIDMPSAIPSFLSTDFLSLRTAPRDARLSALHVSGHLDPGRPNSIALDTLAADLEALSSVTWNPRFDLDIAFRTELGMTYFHPSALATLARAMHTVWQTLRPWIEQAEQRGARVYFVMLSRGALYRYIGGEHNMRGTQEEWQRELMSTLGHMCWRPSMMAYWRSDGEEDTSQRRTEAKRWRVANLFPCLSSRPCCDYHLC